MYGVCLTFNYNATVWGQSNLWKSLRHKQNWWQIAINNNSNGTNGNDNIMMTMRVSSSNNPYRTNTQNTDTVKLIRSICHPNTFMYNLCVVLGSLYSGPIQVVFVIGYLWNPISHMFSHFEENAVIYAI